MNIEKSNKIKEALRETRLKRQSQRCKVFEIKIDVSHLNKKEQEILKMFFVEAKWVYNYILSQKDPFKYDYKTNPIKVMNKEGKLIKKELKYLPAKNRQDVVKILHQNIYALSKIKKKKIKVGKLKFKSSYNSIDLSQYGTTHKIVSGNRMKINGIKRPLRVKGLKQIKETYEIANAKLLKKPSGYYIKLTCFEYIKPEQIKKTGKEVGLDFGISRNITTSDGKIFNVFIEETGRLKGLQTKMNRRQKKGSNNRYKTVLKIQKEYEKLNNRKKDISNKIVNYLLTNYDFVYMQDENLRGWQKGRYGKAVQHSCMGSIKAKLKIAKNVVLVNKWFPSTKMCYQCGKMNEIDLSQRIYKCECGLEEDRDLKASKTILHVGRCSNSYIPMGCREFKPVEKMSDFLKSYDSKKQFSVKQEAQPFRVG